MGLGWFGAPEHNRWLANETHALLRGARASSVPTGFGRLGSDGTVDTSHPVETWTTARTTFVFALGTIMGIPGCRRYADHGVRALGRTLRDVEHGGWYSAVAHDPDGAGHAVPVEPRARKECRQHAYVLLAAAAATAAGRPGAHELLRDALDAHNRYWWDEDYGLPVHAYAHDFTDPEAYRSAASALHTAEAYLAVTDVTGDITWLTRAVQIVDFVVNVQARTHSWRVPEHYDAHWRPLPDYNRDRPDDPRRPYGVVPGHGLEWARLTVQTRAALVARALPVPGWMLEAAEELFDRARTDAWRIDGGPGFVHTTDLDGAPVVHERRHWVVCEGASAAAALRRALLDDGRGEIEVEHYEHCYRSWIDYVEEYLVEEPGLWVGELDRNNEPSAVHTERPDPYHAVQALLVPRLPVWPTIVQALSEGRLDDPVTPPPAVARGRRRGLFSRD